MVGRSSLFLIDIRPKKMCNEAVDDCAHALELVPNCCKTQNMYNKAVDTYTSTIRFVPGCYKTQEMCVIKLLILVLLCFILFPIDIRLKKCVTELLPKIP